IRGEDPRHDLAILDSGAQVEVQRPKRDVAEQDPFRQLEGTAVRIGFLKVTELGTGELRYHLFRISIARLVAHQSASRKEPFRKNVLHPPVNRGSSTREVPWPGTTCGVTSAPCFALASTAAAERRVPRTRWTTITPRRPANSRLRASNRNVRRTVGSRAVQPKVCPPGAGRATSVPSTTKRVVLRTHVTRKVPKNSRRLPPWRGTSGTSGASQRR